MKVPLHKPKLLIIVLSQQREDDIPDQAAKIIPPLSAMLLAAMTPPVVEIELLHEVLRPVDYHTDADFIALSFLESSAVHAYEVASHFRGVGRIVVAGGRYVTAFPDEVQAHFDSILVGEAHHVWPRLVEDMVAGRLKPRYIADDSAPLTDIPSPRYDLIERDFLVPIVTETTRGCPHSCSYCHLNIRPTPLRKRPIEEVLRDLRNIWGLPFLKRKYAVLIDDNFGGDIVYAKRLLREIALLKFWGIGIQCSVDCLHDEEFIELLRDARCRLVLIGMDSLNQASLVHIKKTQNRTDAYRTLFARLHRNGIVSFASVKFGFDQDTAEYYRSLPSAIAEVNPALLYPEMVTPHVGTPLYLQTLTEGRLHDQDLTHYTGKHMVFDHPTLTSVELLNAYRSVSRQFYTRKAIFRRWWLLLRALVHTTPIPAMLSRGIFMTLVYWVMSRRQRRQVLEGKKQGPMQRTHGAEHASMTGQPV